MSISGSELQENNEKIIQSLKTLKQQKDEIAFLIEKQKEEKLQIQNEIERLSYKLILLTKSLEQRIQAKINYEKTIKEINENYGDLVDASGKLLTTINQGVIELETIMDKKTGPTETIPESSYDTTESLNCHPNTTKLKNSLDEDVRFVAATRTINDSLINNSIAEEHESDSSNETIETKKQSIPEKTKTLTYQSKKSVDEVQSFREAYDRQHRNSRTPALTTTKKVHTQEPSLRSLIQKS